MSYHNRPNTNRRYKHQRYTRPKESEEDKKARLEAQGQVYYTPEERQAHREEQARLQQEQREREALEREQRYQEHRRRQEELERARLEQERLEAERVLQAKIATYVQGGLSEAVARLLVTKDDQLVALTDKVDTLVEQNEQMEEQTETLEKKLASLQRKLERLMDASRTAVEDSDDD